MHIKIRIAAIVLGVTTGVAWVCMAIIAIAFPLTWVVEDMAGNNWSLQGRSPVSSFVLLLFAISGCAMPVIAAFIGFGFAAGQVVATKYQPAVSIVGVLASVFCIFIALIESSQNVFMETAIGCLFLGVNIATYILARHVIQNV